MQACQTQMAQQKDVNNSLKKDYHIHTKNLDEIDKFSNLDNLSHL